MLPLQRIMMIKWDLCGYHLLTETRCSVQSSARLLVRGLRLIETFHAFVASFRTSPFCLAFCASPTCCNAHKFMNIISRSSRNFDIKLGTLSLTAFALAAETPNRQTLIEFRSSFWQVWFSRAHCQVTPLNPTPLTTPSHATHISRALFLEVF